MKAIFAAAVSAVVLAASPAMAEGWKDNYKTLKFGILSGENEKDRIARYTPFEEYLEKELGVEVEIFTAGSYDGVIQAIAADQIEFAFFGSSSYAAAYTETNGGVVPLLTRLNKDGSSGYYSVVMVRCDSGYKSLDDLKGKVHAFADPDSTSGFAVPYFNMVQQGYNPKEHFSAIPFSGGHETGVLGVVNKQYDAAATWQNNETDGRWQRMITKGMIEEGVVCPIWESPEITSGPFSARVNLPADLIADMTAAVEAIPEKDFDAFNAMRGGDDSPQAGWKRVDHERYQWIVDMRDWLKKERRG
ncbi:phosphonate ABC transporter substrate-binding protein [Roseibium sp. HPY-6]|uniref:phosphonate ABC transporter substrate-binding protein n=1 Tax=Roseibium sp. HPY-6 TaxID=3229852 RepID=UPI00338F8C8D